MTYNVFIDGEEGTTGLQIRERLVSRSELSLIHLANSERKDPEARRKALVAADVSILCLPDDASREAVKLVEGKCLRKLGKHVVAVCHISRVIICISELLYVLRAVNSVLADYPGRLAFVTL